MGWSIGKRRIRFKLVPQADLAAAGADSAEWSATDNDPQFRLEWTGSAALEAGWYEFSFVARVHSGVLDGPCLYPDYGDGPSEAQRIDLRQEELSDGVRCESIVCFSKPVFGLRFDPSRMSCRFVVRDCHLIAHSRLTAAAWMIREIAGRPSGVRTSPRTLVRASLGILTEFARRLVTRGPREAGGWLHAQWSDRLDRSDQRYLAWVRDFDVLANSDREAMRREMSRWSVFPLISVVLPVYNPPERWLRRCLDSVLEQIYPHWELCIANDASPAPHVRRVLDEYALRDPRIRVVHREVNGHICAASNSALALAKGDFVALLDHDDELAEHALFAVAAALRKHPQAQVLYSDEDKINEEGRRFDPYLKPDFSLELLRGHNMISHLGVYRRSLLDELQGFKPGTEGSQDYDLALRAVERLRPDEIVHIPQVLYHWRAISGSTALGPQEKDYAHVAARRAIAEHLARVGHRGEVLPLPPYTGNWRVRLAPIRNPLVSIIIPTRNGLEYLKRCLDSIERRTDYPAFEIIVVDNGSDEPAVLSYLQECASARSVHVVRLDEPFNFSRINNVAVESSRGEILLFLNNDTEIRDASWLSELVSHAVRPDVGAVGGLLIYPDGRIQHAGIVLGLGADRIAGHAYHFRMRGYPGDKCRALLVQAMSAVTAACMAVSREKFLAVGGFDERLAVAFNDVDLCLRLTARGWHTVWTPNIDVVHHESVSRGSDLSPERRAAYEKECAYMRKRWGAALERDPYYHPALSLDHNDFLHYVKPRGRDCRVEEE